jgi:hypothetical protein
MTQAASGSILPDNFEAQSFELLEKAVEAIHQSQSISTSLETLYQVRVLPSDIA